MVIKVSNTLPEGFIPEITVVGCYCCYKNQFLLLKRHPKSRAGGKWCFPGGKLEKGETRIEGARRELHEEVGISGNLSYLDTLYIIKPDQQYDFSIYHLIFDKKPKLSLNLREHTEANWVTHAEALALPLINDGSQILEYCLQKSG